MASLVKNGSNYGLVWTDKDKFPRQVRESLKTDDRTKAINKKKQLEWALLNGDHDPWERKWYEKELKPDGIGVVESVEEFIKYKSTARGRGGWNEETGTKEAFVMRKFARMNDMPVSTLTDNHLEAFYYREGVNSDHTRNSDYISINTYLNWCIDKGYISKKPTFRPSKPQRKIPKFIYPEEFAQLIHFRVNKIENDIKKGTLEENAAYWHVYSWMILAGTGIRPIELSKIKVNHVERNSLLIGADFTTKVKLERRVPLLFESKQAMDVITNPAFRKMDSCMRNSDYLTGRLPDYAKKELSRDFSATWKACFPEKQKRTLYNLKDTFCVRFLCDDTIIGNSGMKLNDLKEILGHESLQTTEKYLKAIPYGTSVTGTIWDFVPEKW